MKRKLAWIVAALALAAAGVAAGAIAAGGNSGVQLDKKQLAATGVVDGVEAGDPGVPTIEVSSWSWGVTNTGSASSGGGGGAGKADLHTLNITKVVDKASPKLALVAASGQHLPTVTIDVLRPGGSNLPYLELKLTDALVVSDQIGGAGDDQPTESVSFDFQRIELKYSAVDGSIAQARLDQLDR